MNSLRLVEFYSGIGGMHCALSQIAKVTGVQYSVVQAFDINLQANALYSANFSEVPLSTTGIEYLQASDIDKLSPSLLTMSPPCQPYTRAGLQKGHLDNRAKSLHHILQNILPQMKQLPPFFLLENVKDFELSESFTLLNETLTKLKYNVQHFILSPLQFGIPNERLRYYCLAKLTPFSNGFSNTKIISKAIPDLQRPSLIAADRIGNQLTEYLEQLKKEEREQYKLPVKFYEAHGYRFDIVEPHFNTSTCFTKGYGKNFKGSGPILHSSTLSSSNEQILFPTYSPDELLSLHLRLFTPREIANLLHFPTNYNLPSHIPTRTYYQLFGNSINVRVVSLLMEYLLFGRMDNMANISHLMEIILNDEVRYQVMKEAIKASIQDSINTRLVEGSKATTFKDLLLEGKHAPRGSNPLIHECSSWLDYMLFDSDSDPDSDSSSFSSSSSSSSTPSRYDDPSFYDDSMDDTEADQEGLQYKIVAGRGLYKVNVGSFHVKANYLSQIIISSNEKYSELNFHFFAYVPKMFDGSTVQKSAIHPDLVHEDDTIMARVLQYADSGDTKERHIANEFLNFLASVEYGITLKIDNISKVYFNQSTKHPGLALIVLELREPAKKFRKRAIFSHEYMKRFYSMIPDWTKNQQGSKHSRYYIVGEGKELMAFLTNMITHSRHFKRAYYADRSFLQSSLDNVFFSLNDENHAPKKSYKESLAIPVKNVGSVPLASTESTSIPLKIPIPARQTPSDQQSPPDINSCRMLVQLSPRNMPNNSGPLSIQTNSSSPETDAQSLPMPLTPPVTAPDNPWQTVASTRLSRFRNRPRALSSPNFFTPVHQDGGHSSPGATGSPRTGNSKNTGPISGALFGSPRTSSPRTSSPRADSVARSGSPRTTSTTRGSEKASDSRHSHKSSPKLSPASTASPSASTSPRILGDNPGYSSESESTSPRGILKPSKLSSASSPNNTAKSSAWKNSLNPSVPQNAVETLRTASRSYLAVVQNSIRPAERSEATHSSIYEVASDGSSVTSADSGTGTPNSGIAAPGDGNGTVTGASAVSAPAPAVGSESNTTGIGAEVISVISGESTCAGVVKFFARPFTYESDSSSTSQSYNKHLYIYDDDSDISSDEGSGLSSSSGGDFSSDGSTQSSDGSADAAPQTQRVPKININAPANGSTLKSSMQGSSGIQLSSLSTQYAPPLVVLSPRSSSSSSSPSTASPNSSPPCVSALEALVSPRRALVGPTGGPVSPRSVNPLSPRVPNASPRNIGELSAWRADVNGFVAPLVFGSNPLSPRNTQSSNIRSTAIVGYIAPRNTRSMERRPSLLNIVPESPSGNFRAVNYLTEEEKLARMNILQVLLQTGILPGDLSDYPIRNIHQLGTSTPAVNHKLGLLHKKISACFLDYLNFNCRNADELQSKIYDKYVYLYINGIDSDSDDEEQNARRRRLWNVGNSGKDSFRTTVELLNWLQYETTHSPVFYSTCKEELVSRDFFRHCRKCRACFDWQYFHCSKCERCVLGINASEPHSCNTEANENQSEPVFPQRECPEWPSMAAK